MSCWKLFLFLDFGEGNTPIILVMALLGLNVWCIYCMVAVFGLNVTGGCVYSEWNLSVQISGCFHHASLFWFLFKNCYDNMYYVMILKVRIKSNCIPSCFVGSRYHHQRSSLYKLKHHIIKKLSHYAHTFWFYQNFSNLYKICIVGKVFRHITDNYLFYGLHMRPNLGCPY